ncbi:MAG: phage tail sheath subtilisin-like domain-containing protein [Dehalococcoidia bacterium]|nr:phage tail sheath subtilisin-like domain-containing protein [Dehalococcoidia bacterium]
MPITPTYPGVYIEELPSGVKTITGVSTSVTAFIGRTKKGTVDEPVLIQSFADFDRKFGGLWDKSTLSYAVQHYFLHGGKDALIVRVVNGGAKATISLPTASSTLILEASSEGDWGEALTVAVDYDTKDSATLFNLTVQELSSPGASDIVSTETFRNLSMDEGDARFITKVLEQQSSLVRVNTVTTDRPQETSSAIAAASNGDDGGDIDDGQISDSSLQSGRKGLYALDKADLFNLLCIPPLTRDADVDISTTLANAAKYCKDHRAMLIVDPPADWTDVDLAKAGINSLRSSIGTDNATNVAVYFPRLKMADSLKENRTEEFAPCGAAAGIFARIDAQRGVWKAPAGQEASLSGVKEFTYKLTDAQNGTLNPLGLNCLRSFPVYGNVLWGARTLAGADQLASEWKYIPVRRVALFIEESLYRGTQWVVFEPNDEPLWSQIRLNVGAFMHNLFRQGAFQGKTPREAYFVKCDKETTTQNDIDRGIVNILVGFAPLKPAEFVMIKLSQIAGQVQA